MIAPLVLLALFVGAWELYTRVSNVDAFILPPPNEVAQSLWDDRSLLLTNLGVTAQEVGLGVIISLIVGGVLAFLLHLSPPLRRAAYPLLVSSQAIPFVILAPLLVFWFGFSISAKLAIVVIVCFFPIVVTTLDGLRNVDPELLKLMRTLDASRWQTLRMVEAPAALPAALTGAKIAVTVAVIGAVFAEYTGSEKGLGHLLLTSTPQLETARAWAATIVLAALAVALFSVLGMAQRVLVPWTRKDRT
jgi:NitT/TauT family transport system permease protein/putative hydroxymethylpyrimidine transport system permease protein